MGAAGTSPAPAGLPQVHAAEAASLGGLEPTRADNRRQPHERDGASAGVVEPARASGYRLQPHKALLDPRFKIALLLLLSVFCLGGAGGERMAVFRALMSFLPFVLLMVDGRRLYGFVLLVLLVFCNVYGLFLFAGQGGMGENLVVLITSIGTRIIPCIALADYAMRSTTVSEFTAAMGRMRVPMQVTIPMSVMFRYFPTIAENAVNIRDAMRMRGVRGANVGKFVEYRLVPLVECTTRSADDLASSALVRGLGAPVRRTDIARIGFGVGDGMVLAAVVACGVISWVVSA